MAPDLGPPTFLGTWRGSIRSDAIGAGDAAVVFDFQVGTRDFPLLGGTWQFRFPNNVFNTNGTVSAGLDSSRTMLVIFFDRSTVPCPVEPGGTADRGMFSIMRFTDKTMRGDYVVAGCPGGTLELTHQ